MAVACCALAAVASSCVQAAAGLDLVARLSSSAVSSWELVVASDSSSKQSGYRCRCKVKASGAEVGDLWLTSKERLSLGDTLRCIGRFKSLGDDEWGDTSRRQGVWGTIACVRIMERSPATGALGALGRLRTRVSSSFEPESSDARALLDACVTGTRDAMAARGTDELFRRCGVSHLVAVSGGHLSVVAAVAGALLQVTGLGPRARNAALLVLTGLFVVFCGAPISAVRAWVMVALSGGAFLVGRRGHGLSSVCAVGLVMALWNPALSGQLGFVLSVSSVAGLCLFSRYASYALQELLPLPRIPGALGRRTAKTRGRIWRGMCDALGATLVAQAATAPVTARTFGDVSLVAPLANLALGPLFTAVVALGLVAACAFGMPSLQRLVLLAVDAVGGLIICILQALSSLPLAYVSLGEGAVALAGVGIALLGLVLVAWPRIRPRVVWATAGMALVCLTVLLVRWRWFAPARICVLDVGQGDAILVQDGGSALLVDTGSEGALTEALLREHVLHLDAIAITHLHDDHYGGLPDLVGSIPCEQVFVGSGASDNEPVELERGIRELTGGEAEELRYGDVIQVGGFELKVVSPVGKTSGKENADSLIMEVSYSGKAGTLQALLTGDAEKDQLKEVLGRGDAGDIDLLKVGHHGSEVSISSAEAQALDPEVAVASAGEGNSYGHPRRECVDTLTNSGAWFLCTKDVGTVEVRPARDGPLVVCERAGS